MSRPNTLECTVTRGAEAAVFEFGGFRLEPQRRLLTRDGEPLAVTDKAFDALAYLVAHAGQLVTKDDLMRALWPDVIVEESNLYVVISTLRRALKDESTAQRLIATVAGRGYQFVAEVRIGAAPAETHVPAPSAAPVLPVPSAWYSRLANQRMAWLSAAMLLSAIVVVTAINALRTASAPASVVTLAVLPFKPLTPADRNESLEFGMAETLIAGLNSDRLSVSPLSSVRRFAGSEQDVLAAGRALGVQAVLEGHIQRADGELRVSARLLNVSDGRQLWADRYDQAFTNIFSVQDAIAAKVRAALRVHLSGEASPALRRYTADSEAYQLYANGRFHLNRANEAGSRQALADFEQAVTRDPQFALAYVGIAEAHTLLGVFGTVAPSATFPQARRAVDKALAIAPELGEAYASLGHIKAQYEHDWSGAERAYLRAIELSPTFARASAWYGLLLGCQGRFDESMVRLRRAQELEPAQPVYAALIGMVLMYQRRYDEAIEQLQLTLQMDPSFPTTNTYLAAAYLRRGDYEKALIHLGHARTLAPGSQGYAGQIYALSGKRTAALEEIARLRTLSTQHYVSAYDVASIYAALGENDETFKWLERAFEERSPLVGWLRWDAVFDGIRTDPRYIALARRAPS